MLNAEGQRDMINPIDGFCSCFAKTPKMTLCCPADNMTSHFTRILFSKQNGSRACSSRISKHCTTFCIQSGNSSLTVTDYKYKQDIYIHAHVLTPFLSLFFLCFSLLHRKCKAVDDTQLAEGQSVRTEKHTSHRTCKYTHLLHSVYKCTLFKAI